jgi:hypothetical protein
MSVLCQTGSIYSCARTLLVMGATPWFFSIRSQIHCPLTSYLPHRPISIQNVPAIPNLMISVRKGNASIPTTPVRSILAAARGGLLARSRLYRINMVFSITISSVGKLLATSGDSNTRFVFFIYFTLFVRNFIYISISVKGQSLKLSDN